MLEKSDRSTDLKSALFTLARSTGINRIGRYVRRNSGTLLILCYHGISKADEHLWRPTLYMPRWLFRQRLQTLQNFGYQVLPLAVALERSYAGELNCPTAAITFDDGWHDFHSEAWPELQSFGYPATVYQTTYYSTYQKPVFDTACSYLLWKGLGRTLQNAEILGTREAISLNSRKTVNRTYHMIQARFQAAGLSGEDKHRMLNKLAQSLRIDFGSMCQSRLLHLMNLSEVAEVSQAGVDVQLHTHRHKLPLEKCDFLEEININRRLIETATGKPANHFCYPNGNYRTEWPVWLKEAGVVSATTCDPGIASKRSEPMLLPRATDSTMVSQARFESWLSGTGLLISACKQKARTLSGNFRNPSINRTQVGYAQKRADQAQDSAVARMVGGN